MASDPERMHGLYHLPSIPLPDTVSNPGTLYHPNAHFDLYPCSPPCAPAHDQCMDTVDSLLLEKTSGLYPASLSYLVPLSPLIPSTLTLHEKLCGGFRKERVTHASQPVIAKIFNPLYFIDPYEGTNPFSLLDLSVSHEAEAYRRLAPLRGTQVPRCLGLFVSPWPSPGNRSVRPPPQARCRPGRPLPHPRTHITLPMTRPSLCHRRRCCQCLLQHPYVWRQAVQHGSVESHHMASQVWL